MKAVISLYCSLTASPQMGVERNMFRHLAVLLTQEKKRSGEGMAMLKQSDV